MVACAGADFIGLNFYPPSPRSVTAQQARKIAAALRAARGARCPKLVGVFVNSSLQEIRAIVAHVGLDFAQLSGDEAPELAAALPSLAFKAIRPRNLDDAMRALQRFPISSALSLDAPSLLLDAYNAQLYGGTGESASANIARALRAARPRLMLAGGLKPQNVALRIRDIQPWAVDVASGIEADQPGIKDEGKTRAFIAAARSTAS